MDQFIQATIKKAGEVILENFGSAQVAYTKEKVTDIVTHTDLASEKVIIEAIKNNYPDHGIVSEESETYQQGADYMWYIDPLDGTKNFASGVQVFGVNIAVAYRGEITHAAIYLPALHELVYAEKGKGTYINGTKVLCSQKKDWKGVYGVGPVKYTEESVAFAKGISLLSEGTGWINAISSASVSGVWTATGRRDFYIGPSNNSWDYAAPWLISKEAGCVVTNFAGEEWKPGDRGIIVTNKHLFSKLLGLVKESYQ